MDELQAKVPSDDGIGPAEAAAYRNPRFPADPSGDRTPDRTRPIAIASRGDAQRQFRKHTKMLVKQGSWSSESSREEAWEKRRDQFLRRESVSRQTKSMGRCVSDCGGKGVGGVKARPRARSLTDEDLDELRGCIELGFGFSSEEENHELCNTLPALDLYYAINRQYIDCKFKSSPVSTPKSSFDPSSCGSPMSPLCETWRISSPGIAVWLRSYVGCLVSLGSLEPLASIPLNQFLFFFGGAEHMIQVCVFFFLFFFFLNHFCGCSSNPGCCFLNQFCG